MAATKKAACEKSSTLTMLLPCLGHEMAIVGLRERTRAEKTLVSLLRRNAGAEKSQWGAHFSPRSIATSGCACASGLDRVVEAQSCRSAAIVASKVEI